MSTELTVILQDVQHSTHLRKDENARTLCFHGFQKLVKNEHFTGIVNKMLISGERRSGLGAIKDYIGCQQMFEKNERVKVEKKKKKKRLTVGVVTTFSELHNNIEQPRLALLFTSHTVDSINILLQKTLVPFPLHLSHTDIKINLLLW